MTSHYADINHPGMLTHLLQWERIGPGDTIYLRGGTYRGIFTCSLNGTAELPITIKPYPGEHVILDGTLTINGSHTHWYDIEKRYSGGVRETDVPGSSPPNAVTGLVINGPGTKLINCIIHNHVMDGINWWASANGSELYGCIIFDNGWLGPQRGNGHSVYTQNAPTGARKLMKHCILAQSFASAFSSTNLACFTSSGEGLQHYDYIENVFVTGTQLIGGSSVVDDILVDGCHIYLDALTIGYHDEGNVDTTIRNTRLVGAFNPLYMRHYSLLNSLIVSKSGDSKMIYSQEPESGFVGYTSSGNAYHYLGTKPKPFHVETVGLYSFEEWQAKYNTDADTTYSTSAPAANSVHVYPNEYKAGRGHIVVWNWEGLASVNVDVSSVLEAGDSYKLHNATDYLGDVVTGTVPESGVIVVDMQAASHSVSTPDGWDEPLIASTFPTFGAFVVEKA